MAAKGTVLNINGECDKVTLSPPCSSSLPSIHCKKCSTLQPSKEYSHHSPSQRQNSGPLYADDAAIFINPNQNEVQAVKDILERFGNVTGLVTNFEKSSVHPIRCENIDLDHVLQPFPGARMAFPCKYLGLQLHTRTLKKIHVQPLIEKNRTAPPRLERETPEPCWPVNFGNFSAILHAGISSDNLPASSLGKKTN